ncbi:SNARE associated Golgi protein [Rhodotorula toruloides]|uniref:SNARE associated Golgi protein n=1 Tax=Rhodotorula toruloides TaxID=5286 RepID=A0A511KTI1_RHOTO|nr:SNARE associated Golgi protein [Rhodotorula toruloides]
MAARSRSSTLSSTRSPVSHDHQPLHTAPIPPAPFAAPSHNPFSDSEDPVVNSYRSEHSLRTLDPQDREKVKLPKSFEDLKELNEVLQVYRDRNYYRVMGCFVIVYLLWYPLQASRSQARCTSPCSAGALFGVLVALPLVCFCVATGALLCYVSPPRLGPAVSPTRKSGKPESRRGRRGIAPLPPHWMLNLAAPHVGVSVWKFWLSTFLVIIAVLIPVALRRIFAADLADAAQDPQPLFYDARLVGSGEWQARNTERVVGWDDEELDGW